jgi:hypothetical protein
VCAGHLIDDVEIYSDAVATDFSEGYFGILCYQQTASAPVTRADNFLAEDLTPAVTPVTHWALYR